METDTQFVTRGVGNNASRTRCAMIKRVTYEDGNRTHYKAFLYSKVDGREVHCEHEHKSELAAKKCARRMFFNR